MVEEQGWRLGWDRPWPVWGTTSRETARGIGAGIGHGALSSPSLSVAGFLWARSCLGMREMKSDCVLRSLLCSCGKSGSEGAEVEKETPVRRPGKSSSWHGSWWEKTGWRASEEFTPFFLIEWQKNTEKSKIPFRFPVWTAAWKAGCLLRWRRWVGVGGAIRKHLEFSSRYIKFEPSVKQFSAKY